MQRTLAGLVLAGLTLWVCLQASETLRAVALLLAALGCLVEALQLAPVRGRPAGLMLFALVVAAGAPFGMAGWWGPVALAALALAAGLLALRGEGSGALLLGALWIGLPTVALLDLAAGPEGGRTLLFLVLVVVAGEVGAFLGGRLIGGPRLAPGLSPQKTWAGFGCQLLISAGCAPAAGFLLPDPPSPLALAATGLVLGAAAAVGDLYESRWKRDAGQKDSGRLIPGHGGALDRADGLLFAALAFQAVLALAPG